MRQTIMGRLWLGLLVGVAVLTTVSPPASAQQQKRPNVVIQRGGAYSDWPYDRPWWFGGWGPSAAANVAAKAAARAAYDAHDSDFLHRCYQPQRIWNGAYYTWRLASVC